MMESNIRPQKEGLTPVSVLKALNSLSWPIVLSNAFLTSHQIVNMFWVGRLDAGAVAAVSVSFPMLYLLTSLGGGLSVAGSVLVAQYFGARNTAMVSHSAAQTVLTVLVVSAVLSVVGVMTVRPILHLMRIGPDIFEESEGYLKVSFLSIGFIFSFEMFQSILRGIGEVKVPLRVIALSVGLNLGLDPLFIFGWGPLPAGGVVGAAYATLVTYGLAAAVLLAVLQGNRYPVQLRLTDLLPDFQLIRRLLVLGLPASIEQSMDALGSMVITAMVSGFGTVAIAAYGIGFRVLIIILIPAVGLSIAASTLVGHNIGASNLVRAKETAIKGAWYSFLLLSAAGVMCLWCAERLVGMFVPHDSELIEEGATVVRCMAVSFGFFGAQLTLMGALRGAGDTVVPMVLTFVAVWIVQIPTAYLLACYTPLAERGLWYSFPISAAVATALALIRLKTIDWNHLARRTLGDSSRRIAKDTNVDRWTA
jgi:putative MATE family efflux protein